MGDMTRIVREKVEKCDGKLLQRSSFVNHQSESNLTSSVSVYILNVTCDEKLSQEREESLQ